AAGSLRVGAPFLLVAESSAVTVAPANEQEFAQRPFIDELAGLAERAVVAVIEADADERAAPPGGGGDGRQLGGSSARGLLDKDVATAGGGRGADLGKGVVARGDDDHIGLRGNQRLPVGISPGVLRRRRKIAGALRHGVGGGHQPAAGQRPRALAADEAAADDADGQPGAHLSAHPRPRSRPATRRSVNTSVFFSSSRCAGRSRQLSQTALISRPVMPSLAAEPRNTASSAPRAGEAPPSSFCFRAR